MECILTTDTQLKSRNLDINMEYMLRDSRGPVQEPKCVRVCFPSLQSGWKTWVTRGKPSQEGLNVTAERTIGAVALVDIPP